jgi:hypothetical protein
MVKLQMRLWVWTLHGKMLLIVRFAYDGVALASLLAKQDNFSKSAIMSKRGFSGVNGLFRFNIDGLPDRTLTILQITKKGPEIIEAAPRSFSRY